MTITIANTITFGDGTVQSTAATGVPVSAAGTNVQWYGSFSGSATYSTSWSYVTQASPYCTGTIRITLDAYSQNGVAPYWGQYRILRRTLSGTSFTDTTVASGYTAHTSWVTKTHDVATASASDTFIFQHIGIFNAGAKANIRQWMRYPKISSNLAVGTIANISASVV